MIFTTTIPEKLTSEYNMIFQELFEGMKPIELNKEEMKALCKLRDIDIEMGSMEKKLCFKLGMKEVINF